MTPLSIIRASSTTNYPDCKRRGAAQMFPADVKAAGFTIKHLPKSVGAHIGSGVHTGAAVMIGEKIKSGEIGPADVSVDAGIAEMRRRSIEEGVLYDDEAINANAAESQVYRMTMAYRSHIAPHVKPIAVEERLECQVNERLILSGQSDMIAREPGAIRDLKTGKMLGYHMGQVGSYALLTRAHRDIDIGRAIIDFVPRVPLSRSQPEPRSLEYDVAMAEQVATTIISEIDRDLTTFRHGDPERRLVPGNPHAFVANPNSRLCSAKWCGAFHTDWCPESRCKE